jgi:hypothetical protein
MNDAQARTRIAAAQMLRKAHARFRSALAEYQFAKRDAERHLGADDAKVLVEMWSKREEC